MAEDKARQLLPADAGNGPAGRAILDALLGAVKVVADAAYTLKAADNGKALLFSSGDPVTVTVPPDLVTGYQVVIGQIGAGTVTMAEGAGVTINSDGDKRAISARWLTAAVVNYAADTFLLAGSLA